MIEQPADLDAWAAGYLAGYAAAELDIAYRAGALDQVVAARWREVAEHRPDPLAARLAESAAAYAAINTEMGRPYGYSYSGGVVDWETGAARRGREQDCQHAEIKDSG